MPVTRVIEPEEDPNCLHPVVQAEVSSIRTDLDAFNDLEINALVEHGYEVTRSIQRHLGERSIKKLFEGPPWEPLPGRSSLAEAIGTTGHAPVPADATAKTARLAGTSTPVRVAEQLRKSSKRRVWTTLLDFRDWPTYLYLVVAVILLVVLPVRFYRIHRHAALLTSVINSIAAGDPDIRLVLDLVESNPMAGWTRYEVKEAAEPTPSDFSGVDILSRSRILDLRGLDFSSQGTLSSGRVHSRYRISLKFTEEAKKGRPLVLRSYLPITNVEFRHPAYQPPAEVRRVTETDTTGKRHDVYEFHIDLTKVPVETSVTIEIGASMDFAETMPGRIPYFLEQQTELITVWMLFPENHPYRTYKLVRYPIGSDAVPEPVTARYTIDHPYGTLLGWSAINPRAGMVYECRWTGD